MLSMNLSEKQKGGFLITAGLVLLFHTLGIIKTGLDYIIIISSLGMIIYGLMLIDIQKKVAALVKKEKKNKQKDEQ